LTYLTTNVLRFGLLDIRLSSRLSSRISSRNIIILLCGARKLFTPSLSQISLPSAQIALSDIKHR